MGSERTSADPTGHYFDADPATPSRPASVDLTLPDVLLHLQTDRGVFGGGGVDPGSKLLLLEGPPPPVDAGGDLLDLGCGYGPIALTLAKRAPAARVWAIDVNARARALCAANAAAAGLENVRVLSPEELPPEVRFDGIWSNPPIRIGKPALHALLRTWLARLTPGGRCWLVVHKHLGSDSLAKWLESEGHATRRLTSRAGYRILEVDGRADGPNVHGANEQG